MTTIWYTGYDGIEYPMEVNDRHVNSALMTRQEREAELAAMPMADLRSLRNALYLEPQHLPGRSKRALIYHIITEEQGATWE